MEPESNQTISIGDICIGKVTYPTTAKSYKCHIILDSKVYANVYQGFGMTIDEALRDAIATNRKRRIDELTELNKLENAIWGDHELN